MSGFIQALVALAVGAAVGAALVRHERRVPTLARRPSVPADAARVGRRPLYETPFSPN
jgi:hypothetical protein